MKLQLNAEGLDEIPETTTETAAFVTELNVGFNKLRSLAPSIARYRNLRVLRLNHNLLEDLPEEIATLPELRELSLSSNPLRGFPRVLLRIPHLETLHLDQTGLAEIPADFRPGALVNLSLSRNQITAIPEGLFANGNLLRTLRLNQNRLKVPWKSSISLTTSWRAFRRSLDSSSGLRCSTFRETGCGSYRRALGSSRRCAG
jgi:Leucine-rich repeat (LRR) protein